MANGMRTDLRLVLRHSELRPEYCVETVTTPGRLKRSIIRDFGIVSDYDSLRQSLIARLLTPLGELSRLGHPAYGSRLHELIGEGNTKRTQALARLYILEALRQEPRVTSIVDLSIEGGDPPRDLLRINVSVTAEGPSAPIEIGPISLELG